MRQNDHSNNIRQVVTLRDDREAEVRVINIDDVNHIMDLQEAVWMDLEDKTFIVKRSKEELQLMSDGYHGVMVGAFVDGQLVGQGVLCLRGTELHHRFIDVERMHFSGNHALIAGILVHPDFRGNRLSAIMIDVLEGIARKMNMSYLRMETNVYNYWSYHAALKKGFFIGNTVVDPHDGTFSFLLFKPFSRQEVSFTSTEKTIEFGSRDSGAKLLPSFASGYCCADAQRQSSGVVSLFFRKIGKPKNEFNQTVLFQLN